MEEFRTDDITRELGLDQMALIRLGMLLGSDYTEGVAGIGIVNAVEVLQRSWHCQQSKQHLSQAPQVRVHLHARPVHGMRQ